jgi:magnesium transporter
VAPEARLRRPAYVSPQAEELPVAVVDNGIYVDGRRFASPPTLESTYQLLRSEMGMGWIGLYRPDEDEIRSVANEFRIHPLAVEDTIVAHQRPKLERYDDVLFTVLRPARYVADEMRIEFGEVHVFTGADFVVTVRHAESPDLHRVRERLERHPELLELGPEAVLYAILDQVVDEYRPVVEALQGEIDDIESAMFEGDTSVPRKTHTLFREVVAFQHAAKPLVQIAQALRHGFDKYEVDQELRRHLRDVEDHLLRLVDEVDGYRALLQNILAVNAAVIGQQQSEAARRLAEASIAQNEQVKRISAWAAILFAPTLVGTIYGMNFRSMPELEWRLGYPYAFAMMGLVCLALFLVFKRKEWL